MKPSLNVLLNNLIENVVSGSSPILDNQLKILISKQYHSSTDLES